VCHGNVFMPDCCNIMKFTSLTKVKREALCPSDTSLVKLSN